MDGQNSFNKPSPLRNSKAVNRPFQSPMRSVISPAGKIDQNEKRLKSLNLHCSPYSKNLTTPEKRIRRTPQSLLDKICQQTKETEAKMDEGRSIDEIDLKIMRDRVLAKRQELEHLKRQLLYKKKHESKDLKNLTERWLRGCQEALPQFQKDISQRSGNNVEMTEILAQLGIPPKLVQYSIEDGDFT